MTAEERYKRWEKASRGMKEAVKNARMEENGDTEPTDQEHEELDRLEAEILQEVEEVD